MVDNDKRKSIVSDLKTCASELGFHLSGVCPAVEATGYSDLVRWIEQGYAGEMAYLPNRQLAYQHPSSVLAGVRSLVMLAFPYRSSEPKEAVAGQGRIARYAWGDADYHDLIHDRLKLLIERLHQHVPGATARGVVDSAPLLEREFAALAGLGWRGKNTLLLNKYEGSYFFIAALLTDLDLPVDAPQETGHCGTCRACLDACPTDAFPSAGVLDASRCISYLTIEHRTAIPYALRTGIGSWLFGCDVCQDVCPWNRRPRTLATAPLWPVDGTDPVDLIELFELDDESFRKRFRRTPLWRSKRRGILRNAAIVLGNQRDLAAIPGLARGLQDEESLVRGACAWALGKIGTETSITLLEFRASVETDTEVIEEIRLALYR